MPNSLSDIYYGLLAQQMDEPKGLLASNYQNGLLGSPINPIAQRNRLADFGAKVPQARNLTLRDYADVFSGVANNTVMPFLPGAGDYIAARDSAELGGRAAESAKSGSYGDAALWGLQSLGAGLGALPFIPAMGAMTKKVQQYDLSGWPDYAKKIVSESSPLYKNLVENPGKDSFGAFDSYLRATGQYTKKGDRISQLIRKLEESGYDPKIKNSTRSGSKYIEVEIPNGYIKTIRISNHPQSGQALALHGPASINFGKYDGADTDSILDVLKMLKSDSATTKP